MMIKPEQKGLTLGDKLANTISQMEAARIKGLEAQAAADLAKVKREMEKRTKFVEGIRAEIIDQINNDKVPAVKVSNYENCTWVRDTEKGKAAYQDLWSRLIQDFGKEKLRLTVHEGHDGMGMESWLTISVVPSPHKIVYRDGVPVPSAEERQMDPRPVADPRIRTSRVVRDGLDIS